MRTDTTPQSAAIFAANRARGSVRFDVNGVDGVTRRRELHEAGSLRVRFPSPEDAGLSAVLVNTAGGIAGGDRFDINIASAGDARLTVTTAAAEKIYRANGPPAELNVTLKAEGRSHLSWLPQETILFDRTRIHRRFEISLSETASLLLCEIVVFGENVRLDGDIGAKLASPAIAKGGVAIGTALIVPGDEALVERIRELSPTFGGEVGISAWNGFAMARFCAQDAARLRADMMAVLGRASGSALPRLWLN